MGQPKIGARSFADIHFFPGCKPDIAEVHFSNIAH
jgi:hypothetical protein